MAGREARPETREPDVGYVDSDGETPTTERELAEDAEWKKQQKNTFTRWTNEHLKKANCHVDNLETDLSDGLKLAALIEVLANYKFRQLNKKPIFRTQKLENVTKVLNFLQEHEGLKLISIDSSHIVDSNPKLILGLIWTLIMHYSISVATWEGEKSVSQSTPHDASGAKDNKDSSGQNEDEEGRGLGPKQRLLVWVQQKIPESQVKNFTSDWNSGIAIGALVDACAPGLCPDWSIWDRRQPLRNATEAMTLADEWLSVPQLVHPEEMISSNVDEKAMMTYISQFPGAKLKAGAPLRPKISPEKVRTSGPGLRRNGNTLGEECQFSVDASDAGPGQLEVIILNPKGIKETCQVNENANKTQLYTCIYDTHMEGEHRVIIKFSGIEIPNSPFRVNIEGPASDPSKITVDGPGVEQNGENRVGRRTYFNIHAQDAGQGKPECVICDPSGRKDAVKSKITCPNSDADYLVEYTPKDAGVHQVFVSFAGKPIARSPFAVEVGPRESGKAAAVAALTAVVQAAQNPVNSSAPSAVGRLTNGTAKNGSSDEHTNGHLDDEQELSSLRNEMNGKSESPALNPILVASGGPQNTRFKKTFTAIIDGANTLGLILNEGATETIPAFGIACSPELAYTSGRGVQPRGIRVQDEVFFLVHTERTGDDNMPLEVKMIRSDGEVEKVKTTKLCDNVWKCSYVPQRPGKYSISVRYGNKDIQKSPFDIVVGPLKKSDVVAFGPGLHAGVVNQPNVFTVSCKEESSKISFSIEGPSEARMECFNNGDVSARVTYWVGQPGEYAVHITYDDEDIPNSPYMPQIYPDTGETHPNAIRIHGPGIEKSKTSLHVGKPVEFYIEGLPEAIPPSLYRSLSEANLESVLRANCWDAAGNPVPMKARLRPDGSVVFIYTPTSPGTHTITATVGNMSLKGMPYRVYVSPDIEPDKVKMWGPGLENAVRNQITHFFIDPREALGSANDEVLASNPISLRITDGQGNTITPNVIDQTDGTYRVEYTPTIGYGDIRVDAQLGSVPISKIPIRVPVKAEFEARRIRIQGLETMVPARAMQTFTILPADGALSTIPKVTMNSSTEAHLVIPIQVTCMPSGYLVTYEADRCADYNLNVTLDDGEVYGPYLVTVTETTKSDEFTGGCDSLTNYGEELQKDVVNGLILDKSVSALSADSAELIEPLSSVTTNGTVAEDREAVGRLKLVDVDDYVSELKLISGDTALDSFKAAHPSAQNEILELISATSQEQTVHRGEINAVIDRDDAGTELITSCSPCPDPKDLSSLETHADLVDDQILEYFCKTDRDIVETNEVIIPSCPCEEPKKSGLSEIGNNLADDQSSVGFCEASVNGSKFTEPNELDLTQQTLGHLADSLQCLGSTAVSEMEANGHVPDYPDFTDVIDFAQSQLNNSIIEPPAGKEHQSDVDEIGCAVLNSAPITQERLDLHDQNSQSAEVLIQSDVADGTLNAQCTCDVLMAEKDNQVLISTCSANSAKKENCGEIISAQCEENAVVNCADTIEVVEANKDHMRNGSNELSSNKNGEFPVVGQNGCKEAFEALEVHLSKLDGQVNQASLDQDSTLETECIRILDEHVSGLWNDSDQPQSELVTVETRGLFKEKDTLCVNTQDLAGGTTLQDSVVGVCPGTHSDPCIQNVEFEELVSSTIYGQDVSASSSPTSTSTEASVKAISPVGSTSNTFCPRPNGNSQVESAVSESAFVYSNSADHSDVTVVCDDLMQLLDMSPTSGPCSKTCVRVATFYKEIEWHPSPNLKTAKEKAGLLETNKWPQCTPDQAAFRVSASGPGLEKAIATQLAVFTIDCRNAPILPFGVTVTGPSSVEIECSDIGNGTCSVSYIPPVPGRYAVNVIYNGETHIAGSPFIVQAFPKDKPDLSTDRIRVFGDGVESKGVYRSSYVKFVVDASAIDQTSEGTVEAILTDPDKKRMSCQVQSNNDGTYSCSYTPMDEGAHELEVTYEGVPVTGSPFKVQVTSGCDPKRVKAYGPGLEDGSHLEPGKKAEFTVDLTGAGQGGLGLAVEGPSEAPIECQDNRDGTCTVSYVPTEPGPYSVFVRFNDVNVPNSPFSVHVKAKVDPSKVKCSGPGLESGVLRAQWPAYFTVDTKKAGDAALKVMYRPKPGAEMCPATIQPVGSPVNWDSSQPQYYHKVTYTPEEEGPCDIEVTYDGKHVPGSPFRVEVRKSCEPERVRVLGAGVEGPVIASLPTTFTVDAREAGMGDLTLGLTDPRGQSVPVRLVPVSVDNESVPDAVNSLASGDVSDSGLLSCTYQPYLVGPHNIHVMFAGVEVENSPFTVDSLPTGRADLCQIISRIDNAIAVGEECVIPVNTAQAGKGCLTCQVIQQPSNETGASAALLPVDTEDNKDGTTTVFYTPTQLGRLDVELRYGGQLIPDGEFSQKVVTRDELDALKKLPAYRPVEFRLPAPKSDLEVECTVVRPSGEQQLVPHTVTDNNTITVSYEPVEQGMHELHVNAYAPVKPGESRTNAMIMPLQGSPYRFFVDTIGSGRVTAYGPGLSYGVTNHPAEFTVVTKDSGGGGLSLSVEGPSKAEIRCVENGDGTCNVSYLPLAPGKYTISIKFMGQHIAGSPFESKITGELSKRAQLSMGAPNDITLGTIGDDISTLTASVRSASGREEPCVLKRLPNNRLGISFTPKEVGEHLISVYRAGQHIENSPFRIQISEKEIGDPGRVRVSGPGLISGMANQPNQFTVDTREAGYAGLSLTVEGPSKAEIDCHDNRDGTCTVTYTPTEPGSYVINVKYADTHVPNSPFYVEVGGEYSGRVTEQITRHQEASQVTKVGSRCEMSLRVPDLKLSEMTATVISPSGKIAPCEIVPVDEDHYNIKFIPQEMGEHSVHVKYQGADIVGSPFQFTVGPIRDGMANKVRVLGSGIEEGVINEINAFTVYTREAGAGTLSIAIEGPSKAELDCEEQQDGSSYVTYRVGVPGLYTCSLKFNDEEIPFSPFRIYVMEPTDEDKIVSYDLPQTGTTFRGAEEPISSGGEEVASQIGHPIALTIHHKEVEGETLRATVQAPSGAIEEAIVHPIDEDQFAIRFIPHESGPHLFYVHSVPIEKADNPDIILGPSSPYRPIQGSPFRLFISQHAADPGMVTASGEGLRHGKVDMKNMFFVNTANAGSGVLNVTVDGPSKVSLTTQEQDEGYAFTYVPPVPGIYEITIKYGGNFHIAGSPFRAEITGVPRSSALESSKSEQQSHVLLETVGKTAIPRRLVGIRPENQADRVRCDGLGLKRADIRRINYFNVDASQAGSEILLVGIRGPTRPFEEVKIKHLGNNQYSVAYSVKESGRHLLMVKWGENHVPGSPFIVDVP